MVKDIRLWKERRTSERSFTTGKQGLISIEALGTWMFHNSHIGYRLVCIFVCCLTLGLAGCGRPVGDFGRVKPSLIHDKILPLLGQPVARARQDLVSSFTYTDEEKQLRNYGYNIIKPVHAKDWFSVNVIELQRNRFLVNGTDRGINPRMYYIWLGKEKPVSSHTWVTRIGNDIHADGAALREFLPIAARIRTIDMERLGVISRRADLEPLELRNTYARVEENRVFIGWAWRAMRLRIASYGYAIDRLEIASPSTGIYALRNSLRKLAFEANNEHFQPGRRIALPAIPGSDFILPNNTPGNFNEVRDWENPDIRAEDLIIRKY